MKRYLIFILLFTAACNTATEKKPDTSPQVATMEQTLLKEIKQYPDSLILKENLIQYYRENGNLVKAIAQIDALIKHDSLSARCWHIKGTLHYENDDTLQAIASFEKEINILPSTSSIISLGTLYAQTKNIKSIRLAGILLIDFKGKSEKEAYFIKGLYYSNTRDKKEAILFFDKSILIDFTFMEAYREKAIALYDLGKYNEAIAALNKAVTLQNNYDEGYYYLGICYEKIKNTEAAIESFQKALLYNPDYEEAKNELKKYR